MIWYFSARVLALRWEHGATIAARQRKHRATDAAAIFVGGAWDPAGRETTTAEHDTTTVDSIQSRMASEHDVMRAVDPVAYVDLSPFSPTPQLRLVSPREETGSATSQHHEEHDDDDHHHHEDGHHGHAHSAAMRRRHSSPCTCPCRS